MPTSYAVDRAPGFGQVEPNHLSAQRNGQIYAQLPVSNKKKPGTDEYEINILENGQFVKYDYEEHEVNFAGKGEWMLVLNEVKLYEGSIYRESYKDFAMQRKNYTEEGMTPRVFKTMIGDIYTTNCVAADSYKVGDTLVPGATGILEKKASLDGSEDMVWLVITDITGSDHNTMPDGTDAVKLQRIK